ncbi:hypothetical protein FA15DRAFT_694218 [Coprinopsis marcescibilis]|uniref:DUF6533 domain-containing protein n=1 Tax=Coprinopsis marcescibilis TaxID=230819 RepID=A0A5C3KXH0_COPMA|nr:hypothetical protein FA15DRAFT_694218 [Coprinopsis marcescibilis]
MDIDVADFLLVTNNVIATKFTYVIAATLLYYDMALTFEQEVTRVWGSKMTLGTWLFLLNRYVPALMYMMDLGALYTFEYNGDVPACRNLGLVSTLLSVPTLATVKAILIMRTHALYQNRKLLYALSGFAVFAVIYMIAGWMIVLSGVGVAAIGGNGIMGCLPPSCAKLSCRAFSASFWIMWLTFETIIFWLTARKCWIAYSADGRFGHSRHSKMVSVLFRDGLIYYMIIILLSLLNFFMWVFHPYGIYLAVGILRALQATICSRLLLNIRGMLAPQPTTTFQMSTFRVASLHPQPTEALTLTSDSMEGSSGQEVSVDQKNSNPIA